jgi:hypothetical protein
MTKINLDYPEFQETNDSQGATEATEVPESPQQTLFNGELDELLKKYEIPSAIVTTDWREHYGVNFHGNLGEQLGMAELINTKLGDILNGALNKNLESKGEQ